MISLNEKSNKLWQVFLYSLAIIVMAVTVYTHLNFTSRGIVNLNVSTLQMAWPVYFLIISEPLFFIALIITFKHTKVATQMGLIASIVGLIYYLITICFLFFWVSILLFLSPNGWIVYILPSLVLVWAGVFSYKYLRLKL